MQDQEKKFLGSVLYLFMLVVVFVGGVLYEYSYQPIKIAPEVIEVPTLIEVPNVIETVKVIEKECTIPQATQDKGWFK